MHFLKLFYYMNISRTLGRILGTTPSRVSDKGKNTQRTRVLDTWTDRVKCMCGVSSGCAPSFGISDVASELGTSEFQLSPGDQTFGRTPPTPSVLWYLAITGPWKRKALSSFSNSPILCYETSLPFSPLLSKLFSYLLVLMSIRLSLQNISSTH